MLGIEPAVGRLIGPDDDRLGAEGRAAVAVVSWSYWRSRFNLDPAVVGTRITLNGVPATIVGVAPRSFVGLQVGFKKDLWAPAALEGAGQQPSRRGALGLFGRLKPGVSLEQARAEFVVLNQPRIEEIARRSHDPQWLHATLEVAPAAAGSTVVRDAFATPLFVLMAVVGLLLSIACTNVAGLLLARGAARRREMALRVSLGAGRARLVRQVLTEALLLSSIGSLAGVVWAYFAANALVQTLVGGRTDVDIHVQPDLHVALFTIASALVAGAFFGMAPAWQAFSCAPASTLRETGGAGEPPSRRLFGKGLVVAQVALSAVLLSGAGLFARHLANLRTTDLGFERADVLLVSLRPAGSGYDRQQLARLYRDLLQRLEAIPGVRSATLSAVTPIQGGEASRFVSVDGFHEAPEARRYVSLNWVGPKYFDTLGTPRLAGRDFEFDDAERPPVTIVNLATAQYYFGHDNPIGRRITVDGEGDPYEIVGVVGNAKYANLRVGAPRTIYFNAFQGGRIQSEFALRTTVPPFAVAGDVQREVRHTLKTIQVGRVTTLADQMDASIVPERVVAALAGWFGGLGALLAAIGIYGLLAYSVVRRTHEIGVRMALGASEGSVVTMVLKSALGLVVAGLAVGAPLAFWSNRLAGRLVEHLPHGTVLPVGLAVGGLIGVALVAAYLPARRAARVRPLEALRHE